MLKNRSVEMPSGQIIVIGVLLGLFDGVLQLLLVVLVDKLAGLLALIRHELGVSPLLRQRPDLNRLVFGGGDEPLSVGQKVKPSDFVVEGLQDIYLSG